MARRLIEVETESDVTPPTEERLDFDDDTLTGDAKCLKEIDWMKIYQHFEGIYPTVQRFWAPEAVTLLFVIQITHFEKHFEYIINFIIENVQLSDSNTKICVYFWTNYARSNFHLGVTVVKSHLMPFQCGHERTKTTPIPIWLTLK